MHSIIRNLMIVALLLQTQAAQAKSCPVPGGTSSSPTDFARYVSNEAYDEFILQDGWHTFPNLTRSAITIRAATRGQGTDQQWFCDRRPRRDD